jgi:RNA polymerase sigma factor (sigma-70 family)
MAAAKPGRMNGEQGCTMSTPSNAELLSSCQGGNQDAWEQIVSRFSRLIWEVIRGYRLSNADAEDVRQLTWYRLVQNVSRIRDPERLGDWLATVAKREALKSLMRGNRLVLVSDVETLERPTGVGDNPELAVLRAERMDDVRTAVATLSPQCQQMLELVLTDPPPSYEEIAAAMSMAVGSVGPIRTRCLKRLRRALAQVTGPDDLPPAPSVRPCAGCPPATPRRAA